jgi:hypothetical protein
MRARKALCEEAIEEKAEEELLHSSSAFQSNHGASLST